MKKHLLLFLVLADFTVGGTARERTLTEKQALARQYVSMPGGKKRAKAETAQWTALLDNGMLTVMGLIKPALPLL